MRVVNKKSIKCERAKDGIWGKKVPVSMRTLMQIGEVTAAQYTKACNYYT